MSTLAAVVRVSHVGGRNGDSFHADEDQVGEIRRYAIALDAEVAFMEPELSVSGGEKIEKRPGLLAAIEGVESGEFDGIVVANLRRLTRSRSGHEIWERVEAAGGHVYCARERLDTSTPYGRRVRDVEIANAVCEREEFAEMHAERRRKTVEAGIWRWRQTPRGYDKDPDTRKLVPNDEGAAEVVAAMRDTARGMSITALADRLEMTQSGVRQMLKNRVYLGELRDGPYLNEHAHPAIVDLDTFEAAQTGKPRPPRSADGPALLAGLIRCASCGHVMSRKRTANVVYACPARHSGERCPGPASITTALIDAHVGTIALRELERLSVTAKDSRGAEQAQATLADAERERDAYLSGVKAAGLAVETFAAGARERQAAVDVAREALRAELSRRAVVPDMGTGADAWEVLDSHERNQLLRSLLSVVVVARAGGRGSRTPLEDRVRVLAFGADVLLPERSGGEASGIVPIPLPDVDGPGVLPRKQ